MVSITLAKTEINVSVNRLNSYSEEAFDQKRGRRTENKAYREYHAHTD